MIKFEIIYFKCPKCDAAFEGRLLRREMVNESILYSDGKILNDGYNVQPQKMVICPSCGHTFWVEDVAKHATHDKPEGFCYTWNTWRFYGCNFSTIRGKLVLIGHYREFLRKRSYDPKKEIYLRRLLWWAYNDLYRNYDEKRIKYWLSGKMSYGVWSKNRRKILDGMFLFNELEKGFSDNLKRLAELIEKHAPDEDRLTLVEIYRELKMFDKAKSFVDPITRRTHYVAGLVQNLKRKRHKVYKVSG